MVEIGGSVVIDNTDNIERYLQNARRAMAKEDWQEVEKYYNLVEQYSPSNIEAIFFSAYGKAKNSLTDSDRHKRQAVFTSLNNSVSIIDDNFDLNKEAELRPQFEKIIHAVFQMRYSGYVYNSNGQGTTDEYYTRKMFDDLENETIKVIENVIRKFPAGDKRSIPYYMLLLSAFDYLTKDNPRKEQENLKKAIEIAKKIKKIDKSVKLPDYEATLSRLDEQEASEKKILKIFRRVGLLCFLGVLFAELFPLTQYAHSDKAIWGAIVCPLVMLLYLFCNSLEGYGWAFFWGLVATALKIFIISNAGQIRGYSQYLSDATIYTAISVFFLVAATIVSIVAYKKTKNYRFK